MNGAGETFSLHEVERILADKGYTKGTPEYSKMLCQCFSPADGMPGRYLETKACPSASKHVVERYDVT